MKKVTSAEVHTVDPGFQSPVVAGDPRAVLEG